MINPAGAVRQLARRDCETPQAAVTNRQGDKHRWNSVPVIEHVFWRVACRTSHDIGQLLTHQVQARAPRMERGLTRGRQGIGHGGPARLSWPYPPTAREPQRTTCPPAQAPSRVDFAPVALPPQAPSRSATAA